MSEGHGLKLHLEPFPTGHPRECIHLLWTVYQGTRHLTAVRRHSPQVTVGGSRRRARNGPQAFPEAHYSRGLAKPHGASLQPGYRNIRRRPRETSAAFRAVFQDRGRVLLLSVHTCIKNSGRNIKFQFAMPSAPCSTVTKLPTAELWANRIIILLFARLW